jgi:hypothetical protein
MSPKWFHRVRELFQDDFVAGLDANPRAKRQRGAVGAQSIKEIGKKLRVLPWGTGSLARNEFGLLRA